MEFESGSFDSTADCDDGQRARASGRNRVLLREPERCLKCNQQFLSLYPLSVCAEHDGLDRV
ncbi:MAG: hypothetical protein HZB82_05710 [Deltaproteobacteria bacterium]|nr:hypothetical protein [Deltaproteobacteria bacterium]